MKQIYGKIVLKGGLLDRTGKLHEYIPKPSSKHFLTFEDVLRIKSGKIDHMYIVFIILLTFLWFDYIYLYSFL